MSSSLLLLPLKQDRRLTRVGDILRSIRSDCSSQPQSVIERRDDRQIDKQCAGLSSDSTGLSARPWAFPLSSRGDIALTQQQRNSDGIPETPCYVRTRQRVMSINRPHDDSLTEQVNETAWNRTRTGRARRRRTPDPGNPLPISTQRAGANVRLVHTTSVGVQTHFDCDCKNSDIQGIGVMPNVGLAQRASRTCLRGLSCGICFAAGAWAHEGHGFTAVVCALVAVFVELVLSECTTIPWPFFCQYEC